MVFEIIGWIGAVLILSAYFLNQNNYLSADDWRYDVINLLGSGAIGVDVYVSQAWPALGLQVA